MTPDLINGLFEFVGGLLILNHCRAVLRDKAVAGVSIVSTVVFTLWGFWNLWFYPSLNQWWSFCGGVVVLAANALWVTLMFKYRPRPKPVAAPDGLYLWCERGDVNCRDMSCGCVDSPEYRSKFCAARLLREGNA